MRTIVLLLSLHFANAASPPIVFTASGGYPRTTLLANGTTLLATSQGGTPEASCGLFATEDSTAWREITGPKFVVIPGSDLSNCAPGEAPDGALLIGVRHHDPNNTLFRIQSTRSRDFGYTWEAPVTIYATTLREHAAWEPVFFHSSDGTALRVAYSLERPANWVPPDCEPGKTFPGSDLSAPEVAVTADLCQGRCAGNSSCNAWTWRSTDQMCWLKSARLDAVPSEGITSGLKLCGAGLGWATNFMTGLPVPALHKSDPDVVFHRSSALGSSGRVSFSTALQQDIVMQESKDGGGTWGPVRVVSRTLGSRDGMPSLVRQKDGCVMCVFEGFGGTAWGHFTVNGVTSCDDGKTWVKQEVYPQPSPSSAHAPTVALLPDGRASVSSYDEHYNLQLQFSTKPLAGSAAANWTTPIIEVPGPIHWPDLFTDSAGDLLLAFQSGGNTHVAGPVFTGMTPLWM